MAQHETKRAICIAATFTAEPVSEGLRFWFDRLDTPTDIAFAAYGQLFQSLLDPSSELGRNRHGANLLFVRWGDLSRPGPAPVDDLVAALRESCERTGIPHLVVTGPPEPDSGCNESALDAELCEKISPASPSGVPLAHVIRGEEVLALYPVAEAFDADAHRVGHVPYTEAYFAALATKVARALRALEAPPRKVIALDCDNTLWGGVVGEDGPEGVDVEGAFAELQSFCVRQNGEGKLLCLASKNVEADVWAVFDRHAMPLERRHVTAHRINWLPKSQNLPALAEELGLGLDSFVFIDDSPVECGEMRIACPEVLTVELPKDPAARPRLLAHLWALDQLRVTSDDRKRAQTYKDNAERGRMRKLPGAWRRSSSSSSSRSTSTSPVPTTCLASRSCRCEPIRSTPPRGGAMKARSERCSNPAMTSRRGRLSVALREFEIASVTTGSSASSSLLSFGDTR